jgi:small subunit ribosomal protein S9
MSTEDTPSDEQTPEHSEQETPDTSPAPEPTPAEDTSSWEAPGASDTDREAEASRASASETDVSSEAQPEGEPSAQEEPEEPADVELPPRQRPEIPGADLIPDIPLAEDEEFLDAEARAAAEAEAEARAAREREQHEDVETRPIADAAIDLAAGARYTATGKRKTSVARVILKPGSGAYAINGKPLDTYFPRETLRRVIRQPLESVGYDSRMDVVARMHGGGVAAQAEALRHGISRALIVADPHLRGELKRRGFLTRDPRVKERKKAGLKKARKRPQFSKR